MKTVHIKNDWGRFDGEDYGHSNSEFGHITKNEKLKTHVITAYKVKWED